MKEIKNDLEELDVMQGIDFKTNKKKVRDQEKNKNKKEKFKKNIRNILLVILLICLFVFLKIQKDSAIDSCVKNGNDKLYCEEHVL